MNGTEVRAFRESLDMKIGEFAERCGYSWSQMQRIEKGKYKVPLRLIAIINTFKGRQNNARTKHGPLGLRKKTRR